MVTDAYLFQKVSISLLGRTLKLLEKLFYFHGYVDRVINGSYFSNQKQRPVAGIKVNEELSIWINKRLELRQGCAIKDRQPRTMIRKINL